MRRRRALAGLGAALAATPARAQVAGRPARVGLLYIADTTPALIDGFRQRLAALGWVEGRNLEIVGPGAGGSYDAMRAVASTLVSGGVDVIVSRGGTATRAAVEATRTIPIVALTGSDYVAAGYAASMARPGGNITGVSSITRDLEGKRLDLVRESLPHFRRIAILYSPDSVAGSAEARRMGARAEEMGFSVDAREVHRIDDFAAAVSALAAAGPAVLMPVAATLLQTASAQRRLGELALRHRMPGAFVEPDAVRAGGLLSYGVDVAAMWVRAAEYADRILRGAKPGDLPIEEPTRLQLVVNLATARTLGITLPPTVVARADEVIE